MAERKLLVAKDTFTHSFEGAPYHIHKGMSLVWSDDPFIRGIEYLFEPARAHRDPELWETATAAPGEKR